MFYTWWRHSRIGIIIWEGQFTFPLLQDTIRFPREYFYSHFLLLHYIISLPKWQCWAWHGLRKHVMCLSHTTVSKVWVRLQGYSTLQPGCNTFYRALCHLRIEEYKNAPAMLPCALFHPSTFHIGVRFCTWGMSCFVPSHRDIFVASTLALLASRGYNAPMNFLCVPNSSICILIWIFCFIEPSIRTQWLQIAYSESQLCFWSRINIPKINLTYTITGEIILDILRIR